MKGIGIDLCTVSRIERAMNGTPGFLERSYTPEEIAWINQRGVGRFESAAAMFAAKEAFLKALGIGIGGGVRMKDVTVIHDELGAPSYRLLETALAALEKRGIRHCFLSLTHEGDTAAAVCVLE